VAICTPNALHAGQARQALASGKDVLVQKPLALAAADAEATVQAAAQAKRLLVVDYSYRFLATLASLRGAIDRPVVAARATFHNIYGPGQDKKWFFNAQLSGGGALIDLGVHLLDLGLFLLQPRQVVLEQVTLQREAGVEHAAALRVACDATPFDVEVSWHAPLSQSRIAIELHLDNGSIACWENVEGSFFHFRARRDGATLLDRETTLREDTLRAFAAAVHAREAPPIDTRVYALLDQAYGRPAMA
jgi:predicted dehydrogenase